MVLEADTIPILVRDFPCIIDARILVHDGWCRLQHINKEHSEKKANKKWHQLEVVEELHFPYR